MSSYTGNMYNWPEVMIACRDASEFKFHVRAPFPAQSVVRVSSNYGPWDWRVGGGILQDAMDDNGGWRNRWAQGVALGATNLTPQSRIRLPSLFRVLPFLTILMNLGLLVLGIGSVCNDNAFPGSLVNALCHLSHNKSKGRFHRRVLQTCRFDCIVMVDGITNILPGNYTY